MRLIDADKLDEDVEYWNMHDDPKQKDYDTRDIEDVLREQPEVEAIPVSWLKDKIGALNGKPESLYIYALIQAWRDERCEK